jgi:hypothetical protein
MEVAYKRYLMLHARHPDLTLAPEQDVDRFWHMHILDTRKYAADCEATFGYFLHHFPYLGLRGEEDAKALQAAYLEMQRLSAEEFGEPSGVVLSGGAQTCGGMVFARVGQDFSRLVFARNGQDVGRMVLARRGAGS